MEPADDPNEKLACLSKDNVKYLHTGKISPYIFPEKRVIAHEKKIYHLIVRIFAFHIDNNGEVQFLIQKRSKFKKSNPEYFTDSASGHVGFKEDLGFIDIVEEAKKELYEEMGVKPKRIEFYTIRQEFEKEYEVSFIFIMLIDSNINPNPNEVDVAKSRFYSKSEVIHLLDAKTFIPITKELWATFINEDITQLFSEKVILEKKDRSALFIGRFQPFHLGHLSILKKMFEENSLLKIGIGSSQESNTKLNPFSADERRQFIKESLKNLNLDTSKVSIYDIPDLYDADKWANSISEIVGDIDILYAPNEWMRNLFANKRCIIVKPEFLNKDEYNGQNIRDFISEQNNKWKNLVPKPVIDLIERLNGIERIKKLYSK